MKTVEIKIYQYQELSDKAKETARESFQDMSYGWWDCVYDDVKGIAKTIGIEIEKIYFNGFCSQGDGACFEGRYDYKKESLRAIKEYAPMDNELHNIVERLQIAQRRAFYSISATTKHRGYYCHSGCMVVDFCENNRIEFDRAEVRDCLRLFADWIYTQLEAEYNYLTSLECIEGNIIDNEYKYTADGLQFWDNEVK